jgi:SCY1-like protein 2
LEIDELEIQKGLLQVSKALEFLHENAGLVHGNLTPDAVLVNAKASLMIS